MPGTRLANDAKAAKGGGERQLNGMHMTVWIHEIHYYLC
jgi:hypothetical protein